MSWKLWGKLLREMNDLLYKGETIVFILVKRGNEHEALCLAHYHIVVFEEQEEV